MRALTTRLGWLEATPPEIISERHAPRLLQRQPRERQESAIVIMHWLYGAAGGAVFGALPARIRLKPWAGPAFGAVVWLGFELGIVPLLGLRMYTPSSVRQRAVRAVDHLLYGAVLSELRRRPQQ